MTGVRLDDSNDSRPALSWSGSSLAAGGADFGIASVRWTGAGAENLLAAIVPSNLTSVQFPELPSELSDFAIASGATFGEPAAQFVDFPSDATYQDMLADRQVNVVSYAFIYSLPYQGTFRTTRFPGE